MRITFKNMAGYNTMTNLRITRIAKLNVDFFTGKPKIVDEVMSYQLILS